MMKKLFISLFILSTFFTSLVGFAKSVSAETGVHSTEAAYTSSPTISGGATDQSPGWVGSFINGIFSTLVQYLLKFVALLTGIAGLILNGAIYYTVVNAKNAYNLKVINDVWKVVRDLCNMSFIFILVYEGILTILGKSNGAQKVIVRVVTIAILINFSLFATRLAIDASNLFTLTIYDAIAPNAAAQGLSQTTTSWPTQWGLANAFMQQLKLQTIYDLNKISGLTGFGSIFVVGLMGVVMLLIATFVFFAVGLLFLIRYVVLILLLILSPFAFVASLLPSMFQRYGKQWTDALIGHATFPPVYMFMTYITLKILSAVMDPTVIGPSGPIANGIPTGGTTGTELTGAVAPIFGTFAGFTIVIILLIISLTTAKEMASKAGSGVGTLVGKATGWAGGATFGALGLAGRGTFGAAASRLAQSERFQQIAANNVVGQFALNRTNRLAQSSFDFRASRAANATLGAVGVNMGKAQEGGREAVIKRKTEQREKFTQTLRTNAAKEAYAQRIAGGALTRGGSRSSANTAFGILGRHNRIAAAKILNDRITKLQGDINNGNAQLGRFQNLINQHITANPRTPVPTAAAAVLNPTQLAQYNTLNGTGPGSLTQMNDTITNLQNQVDNLGLNNLTAAQQTANIAARTAGNQAPHRGTRADEQRF